MVSGGRPRRGFPHSCLFSGNGSGGGPPSRRVSGTDGQSLTRNTDQVTQRRGFVCRCGFRVSLARAAPGPVTGPRAWAMLCTQRALRRSPRRWWEAALAALWCCPSDGGVGDSVGVGQTPVGHLTVAQTAAPPSRFSLGRCPGPGCRVDGPQFVCPATRAARMGGSVQCHTDPVWTRFCFLWANAWEWNCWVMWSRCTSCPCCFCESRNRGLDQRASLLALGASGPHQGTGTLPPPVPPNEVARPLWGRAPGGTGIMPSDGRCFPAALSGVPSVPCSRSSEPRWLGSNQRPLLFSRKLS